MLSHFRKVIRPLLSSGIILLVSAFAQAELKVIEGPVGRAELQILGDVKTVLDGVSTGSRFLEVDPSEYLVALGCASVHDDVTSQGETLFVNGSAFVKSVDIHTSYATQRTDKKLWASFLAGLTTASLPTARYRIEGDTPISVDALYKQLHQKHGRLIAITGTGHFPVLSLSAVKRAPVYGESILGDKRSEYFHPTEVLVKADTFFYGLSLRSNAEATETTRKVFYINPADELSTARQSHTHCGILKADSKTGGGLDGIPDAIGSVAHVLTQSRLASGEIAVYELTP